MGEQYLIRAEARAQQNKILDAQNDLNAIRSRANLTSTSAGNKDDLLNAILRERRLELFLEWGHRWFDLKRSGNVDKIMAVAALQKVGSWNNNKINFPLSQSELSINQNLTQNPGY